MEWVFINKKNGELALIFSPFYTLTCAKLKMGKDYQYLGEL